MARLVLAFARSRMMINLPLIGHEQARQRGSRAATALTAGRTATMARRGAGGRRTLRWCDAHDTTRPDRAVGSRRLGAAGATPSRVARRARCRATERAGRATDSRSDRGGIRHRIQAAAARAGNEQKAAPPSLQQAKSAPRDPAGLLLPPTLRTRARARRVGDQAMESHALARAERRTARQDRTLLFIAKSRLRDPSLRARRSAPPRHNAALQNGFNWTPLSAISGVPFRRFHFRLSPAAPNSQPILQFLNDMAPPLRQPVRILCNGVAARRMAVVQAYMEGLNRMEHVERIPAYAPEPNPSDYVARHLTHHEPAALFARTPLDHQTRTRILRAPCSAACRCSACPGIRLHTRLTS